MTYSAVSSFLFLLPLLFVTTCVTPDVNTTASDLDYQTPAPLSLADPPMDSLEMYDFRSADLLVDESDFRIIAHPKRDFGMTTKELLRALRKQQNKVLNFLEKNKKISKTEVHLYHRAEDKGILTKKTQQATVDFPKLTIHLVINKLYPYGFSEKENLLYLRAALEEPATPFLEEGLAVYLCKDWQRLGYSEIANRIIRAEGTWTLAEFMDYLQFSNISPIIKTALSGYFVNFLLETYGKVDFLSQYNKWTPDVATLALLENAWNIKMAGSKNNRVGANAKKNAPSIPYLKGFNFAHEGYQVYNGYGSRMAQQSLQRISSLSANAVAIIPYTFMRDAKVATPIPISQRAGQENDEATVRSHYDAQQLGLKTLLKPQIWLRKSWPGEIDMNTPEKWDLFFSYYTSWILHYALLAEIHQFDLLCIGVEMSITTLEQPEAWQQLIRKIKTVYHGPITYSANWGEEFEELTFWQDLDYMGVSCYYPLTKQKNISKENLKKSFSTILKNLQKVQSKNQRPLLLTEIGFRNIDHPWTLPHAEPDGRPENPAHQEIAYRVVLENLQEADFIAGTFWWKYPANLNYKYNNAFTPLRLPAEATLERFFRRGDWEMKK